MAGVSRHFGEADEGLVCARAESVLVPCDNKRALLLEGQHLSEQQGPLLGKDEPQCDCPVQEQPLLDAVHSVPLRHMSACQVFCQVFCRQMFSLRWCQDQQSSCTCPFVMSAPGQGSLLLPGSCACPGSCIAQLSS